MKQLTSMRITAISFQNFRNHTEEVSYPLYDLTYIAGHNRVGKTTMAHGVAYALFGVSYYGEQNIERLMNENAKNVSVCLDFVDQNGEPHQLVRSRRGKNTTLTLDTYTVRQADIDHCFCPKEAFLSMFNPFYLVERAGEEGRGLVLKHLCPVPTEEVLKSISKSFRSHLDGLKIGNPVQMLSDYNKSIRRVEEQLASLDGHKTAVKEARQTSAAKAAELSRDLEQTQQSLAALRIKQFEGLDRDSLVIRRDMLNRRLAEDTPACFAEINRLELEINRVQQRPYQSKYGQPLAELAAQMQVLTSKYTALCNKAKGIKEKGIKPGTRCPTCFQEVSADSVTAILEQLQKEIQTTREQGNTLVAQQKELVEYAAKEKAVFEQFKVDDAAKLEAQLTQERAKASQAPNRKQIQEAIVEIEETLQYGNLSESERVELSALEADIIGIQAQLDAQAMLTDDSPLDDLTKQQWELEDQITHYKNIIESLAEFIAKQTELTVAPLQMPNVKIKLYDVVRSTGEVKNVFRFTYKGRDFSCLSLSEKTLAGIEVAAMMRTATGIDCPICIDNTESIDGFNGGVPMPSQTLLLRCVKGQALTVKGRNQPAVTEQREELPKAS